MREIKFRAFEEHSQRMYYNVQSGIYMDPDEFESFNDILGLARYKVMQFTGLKDKNGDEIYEGDVILITYDEAFSELPYYIGEVKFRADDNYPAFDLLPWIDCEMNALSWLKSESDPSVKSYAVIGNIYQNPDLLKEEAQ